MILAQDPGHKTIGDVTRCLPSALGGVLLVTCCCIQRQWQLGLNISFGLWRLAGTAHGGLGY